MKEEYEALIAEHEKEITHLKCVAAQFAEERNSYCEQVFELQAKLAAINAIVQGGAA